MIGVVPFDATNVELDAEEWGVVRDLLCRWHVRSCAVVTGRDGVVLDVASWRR